MSVHPLKNKIYFNTHTHAQKYFGNLSQSEKNTTTNNK